MALLRPSVRIIARLPASTTLRCAAVAQQQQRAASSSSASASSTPTVTVTHSTSNASSPLLSNIEATWVGLPEEEQYEVYRKLEEVQKMDWKSLTVDEKKAAYYVAYGAHGPRTPVHGNSTSGSSVRVFLGTGAAIGLALTIFLTVRSRAPPPPVSMNKEHQEALNARFKEEKINPITGIGSDDYKGKGFAALP